MRRDITGSRQTDWILDIGLSVFCIVLLVLTTGFILVVHFIISRHYHRLLRHTVAKQNTKHAQTSLKNTDKKRNIH